MKKINIRELLFILLSLLFICFLKKNYLLSTTIDSHEDFIYKCIIFFGNNTIVNLIWFIPFLIDIYIFAKNFYYKLLHFDVRFKNRKKYLNHTLIIYTFYSLVFNLFIALSQIVILILLIQRNFASSSFIIAFIIKYALELTVLNLIIIYIAIHIKNFIYATLLVIVIIVIILNLAYNNIYLPFLNLFSDSKIQVNTLLIIILMILLIKKHYLHCDIGGIDE